MKIDVHTFDTKKHSQVDLDPIIFEQPTKMDIIGRVIRWQNARSQTGNHQTKTIAQISGTTRKPYKQKGTGNARQGSLRSPQFRGGATIFGPQVRSHAHALPKKIRKLGLMIALSYKAATKSITILNSFEMKASKTKDFKVAMDKFSIRNALILGANDESLEVRRAVANLKDFDFLPVEGLNVLDIVRKEHIVLTLASLEQLKARLS